MNNILHYIKKNIYFLLILSSSVFICAPTSYFTFFELVTSQNKINNIDDGIKIFRDSWTNNIYGKEFFGEIDSILSYIFMNDLDSQNVILGKDNWLFYRSKSDERIGTIGDYTGQNAFSDNEIDRICINVSAIQDSASKKGIKFCLLVGPNKSIIYDEYMPDRYTKAASSRTESLINEMQKRGINAIYPKHVLKEQKSKYSLYYRYDTHWNQIGAFVACNEVIKQYGLNAEILDNTNIVKKPLKYRYCAQDDLAAMTYMRDVFFDDEIDYLVPGNELIDWPSFENEQESGNLSHFHNSHATYDYSILVVGDSFRTAMMPALINYFRDVYVITRESYYADIIDQINPDCLLLEIVERSSSQLCDFKIWSKK